MSSDKSAGSLYSVSLCLFVIDFLFFFYWLLSSPHVVTKTTRQGLILHMNKKDPL